MTRNVTTGQQKQHPTGHSRTISTEPPHQVLRSRFSGPVRSHDWSNDPVGPRPVGPRMSNRRRAVNPPSSGKKTGWPRDEAVTGRGKGQMLNGPCRHSFWICSSMLNVSRKDPLQSHDLVESCPLPCVARHFG